MTPRDTEDRDMPAEVDVGEDSPKWMVNLTRAWLERFGLSNLMVNLKVTDDIHGDEDVGGEVDNNHNYLFARITMRRDASDDAEHNRYVIHEVSHLAHGEMLFFVNHVLIPQLPKDARKGAKRQWEHVMEQYNTVLTRLFYRLSLPTDYPERIEPLPKEGDHYAKLTLVDAAQEVIDWCALAMPQLIRDRPEFAALAAGLDAYQETLDAGETDPDPGTLHAGVIAKEDV